MENGDFESDTYRWGWGQWKGDLEPGYVNRDDPYMGLASYTMTVPGETGDRKLSYDVRNIDPSMDYEVGLVLRSRGLPEGSVTVGVLQWTEQEDGSVQPAGFVSLPGRPGMAELVVTGGTTDWVPHSVRIPSSSIKPETRKLTMILTNTGVGQGELDIDEASLVAHAPTQTTSAYEPSITSAPQAAGSLASGNASQNLIRNGGFEEGVQRWFYQHNKGKVLPGEYMTGDGAFEGTGWFRMHSPDDDGARLMAITVPDIDPSKSYRLEVAFKGKDLPWDSVSLDVMEWGTEKAKQIAPQGYIFDPYRPGIKELYKAGGTFDWELVSLDIPSGWIKPSTSRLTITINKEYANQGMLEIDAVRLIETDSSEAPAGESPKKSLPDQSSNTSRSTGEVIDNLVQNGDFENGMARWFFQQNRGKTLPGKHRTGPGAYQGNGWFVMQAPAEASERFMSVTVSDINPAESYRLSIALKGKDLPQDSVSIDIMEWGTEKGEQVSPQGYVFNPAKPGVKQLLKLGGSFDWKVFTVDVPSAWIKPSTSRLTVSISKNPADQGMLEMDDLKLYVIKANAIKFLPDSAVAPPPKEESIFVVETVDPANIYEGDTIELRYGLSKPLPGLATLRASIKDYWGEAVWENSLPADQLDGLQALKLEDLRGWFELTLEATDAAGKPIDSYTHTFIVLAEMPKAYYEPDFESMFGVWGQIQNMSDPGAMGIDWLRSGFYWKFLQPDPNKPVKVNSRWANAAPNIPNNLVLLGHHLVPDWADARHAEEGVERIGPLRADAFEAYLDYIRAVVTANKGHASAWEIWNEPYFETELWPDDPASYFKLHKATYEAIKEIDPDTPVVGICLNPYTHAQQMKELFAMGILDYCDGVSIHPYTQNTSPESADFRQMLQSLKAMMREYGEEKPLWNTEYGWRGDANSPVGGPENQARYIVRSHLMQLAENVRNVTYWTIWANGKDESALGKWRSTFGYFDAYTSQPRPSAAAYGVMTRMLHKAKFVRDISGFSNTTHALLFKKPDDSSLLALWNHRGQRSAVIYTASPLTVTDMMGEKTELSPNEDGVVALAIGEDPIYVEGLTEDAIKVNDTLLKLAVDSGDIVDSQAVLSFDAGTLPEDLKELELWYPDGAVLRGETVPVDWNQSQPRISFQPELSITNPPGTFRVLATTGKGKPVGFILANLVPELTISDYFLSLENDQRNLSLKYVCSKPGGIGALLEFSGKDQKIQKAIRIPGGETHVDIELPDELVDGKRYYLKVLYSSRGDTSVAYESPFYFVPAIEAKQPIRIDGNLNDWTQAKFIDFRTDPFYGTRLGNLNEYDMESEFALQWDDSKLYIVVKVSNDEHYQTLPQDDVKNAWREDSIQIGFDPFIAELASLRPTGETQYVNNQWPFYQFTLARLMNGAHSSVDFTSNPEELPKASIDADGIELAVVNDTASRTTVYEVALSAEVLKPAKLEAGARYGLSIILNDADPGRTQRLSLEWSGGLTVGKDYSKFGSFFLAQ